MREQKGSNIDNEPLPLREGEEDMVDFIRWWLYKREFDGLMEKEELSKSENS